MLCVRTRLWCACVWLCCLTVMAQQDLRGEFCRGRCCPGRDDTCSAPILGTVCYCDRFCNRTSSADCCPDFWRECLGAQPPPELLVRPECFHKGRYYKIGHTIKINCNRCECVRQGETEFKFSCEQRVCLVRPELIEAVNAALEGWRATNYSFFWGDTLQEGVEHRLGTYKPTRLTAEMPELHQAGGPRPSGPLPEAFDARSRWDALLQPIADQGDCAASWALSTTAVASDRAAIESLGAVRPQMSAQHLLSCQLRSQRGCRGGHLDRAWYFLRKHGVSSESCFPYSSGDGGKLPECPFRRSSGKGRCADGSEPRFYMATPPYRIGPGEEDIMREIYLNGPVQATFEVHADFFSYGSGVYHHLGALEESLSDAFQQRGWHSVRMMGWGAENAHGKPIKYWVCANSWGEQWGEEGLFRILRGSDESSIETFVLGAWAPEQK